MKLPNAESAVVEFQSVLGMTANEAGALRDQILAAALHGEVISTSKGEG